MSQYRCCRSCPTSSSRCARRSAATASLSSSVLSTSNRTTSFLFIASPRCSQVCLPEVEHQLIQMKRGGFVGDAVLAHRIRHHLKLLPTRNQRVDKRQLVVRMHVVVIRSEDDQELGVQLFRER